MQWQGPGMRRQRGGLARYGFASIGLRPVRPGVGAGQERGAVGVIVETRRLDRDRNV